jgi:hypothetical protein
MPDDNLGLGEAVEDLAVEQFVAKLRVEALAVAVLARTSGLDERGIRADICNPLPFRKESGKGLRRHASSLARSNLKVKSLIADCTWKRLGLSFPTRQRRCQSRYYLRRRLSPA